MTSTTRLQGDVDKSKFKYYSAIRTGFKHMETETKSESVQEYLKGPTHVIDDNYFIYPLPLIIRGRFFLSFLTFQFSGPIYLIIFAHHIF